MDPPDIPKKDLLAEYGSRAKAKHTDRVDGVPNVKMLDLNDEEEHNQLAVKFLMKKYHKVCRWMYKKYTSKGYRSQTIATFSSYHDQADSISLTDLWAWRNDFQLNKYITKDELTALVRLINIAKQDNNSKIKKNEARYMDFERFKDLII